MVRQTYIVSRHYARIYWSIRSQFLSSNRSLSQFRKGTGVGNELYKISIRYRELSRFLKKFMRKGTVVLEYGSGSSSILFNSLKRVSRLISIEEKAEFLPTIKTRKSWITPELTAVFHYSKQYKSKVFLNSEPFVSMAHLVYVDGPSNNKNSYFGLSEPNLELILMNNLDDKWILVDCRTLTVCELYQKLESSHFFAEQIS